MKIKRRKGKNIGKYGESGIKNLPKLIKGKKYVMQEKNWKTELPDSAGTFRPNMVHTVSLKDPITDHKVGGANISIPFKKGQPRIGQVLDVKVNRDLRNQKLGKKVVSKITSQAKLEGLDALVLHFNPEKSSEKHAGQLYRKNGFVPLKSLPKTKQKFIIDQMKEQGMPRFDNELFVKFF